MQLYSISLFLDTRRAKKSGKYPLKLRVYSSSHKKPELYPTRYDFTEEEYNALWETQKPRADQKALRGKLNDLKDTAEKVAEKIVPFNFDQFERKLYNSTGDRSNVFFHYDELIEKFDASEQIGNASNYRCSLASIKSYLQAKHPKNLEPKKLAFIEINPEWLESYENYMIKTLERSRTTVSMYTRALRAVFNSAIRAGDISDNLYPFGRGKYIVPSQKKVKKALATEQLSGLFHAEPQQTLRQKGPQQKAKDFWYFSYACNGMNIKDIAHLRYEQIDGDFLIYYREKTINTKKADLKPIRAFLSDQAKEVIEKYGRKPAKPKSLIFDIIEESDDAKERRRKVQNFTRMINHNFGKLAKNNDMPEDITTYWARHSFSTNALRNGASMEMVGDAMGHSDTKTTKGYFDGFEDEEFKKIMQKVNQF
jgi:integrase